MQRPPPPAWLLQLAPAELPWGPSMQHLAAATATLLQHGWPPTFLLMYDELWTLVDQAADVVLASTGNAFNMVSQPRERRGGMLLLLQGLMADPPACATTTLRDMHAATAAPTAAAVPPAPTASPPPRLTAPVPWRARRTSWPGTLTPAKARQGSAPTGEGTTAQHSTPQHSTPQHATAQHTRPCRPRRDRQPDDAGATFRPDGSAKYTTLWVPFVEATPENSCLYCVPK